MASSNIKTIFFDLDGTLRFNEPNGREFFLEHAQTHGPKLSLEDRIRMWHWENSYWAESELLLKDHEQHGDTDAFWLNYSRRQLEAMNYSNDLIESLTQKMHEHMRQNYRPQNLLMPDTHEALSSLRNAGYAMGVLSNRSEPFDDELKELGISDYFTWTIPAGQAGIRKPHPGAFHLALRLSGFSNTEVIYVGDNYFADVVGARNAGIQPVLIDPAKYFQDPDCPVITSLNDLPDLINNL